MNKPKQVFLGVFSSHSPLLTQKKWRPHPPASHSSFIFAALGRSSANGSRNCELKGDAAESRKGISHSMSKNSSYPKSRANLPVARQINQDIMTFDTRSNCEASKNGSHSLAPLQPWQNPHPPSPPPPQTAPALGLRNGPPAVRLLVGVRTVKTRCPKHPRVDPNSDMLKEEGELQEKTTTCVVCNSQRETHKEKRAMGGMTSCPGPHVLLCTVRGPPKKKHHNFQQGT